MSNPIANFARGSSPVVAAVAGAVGATGGGGVYLSLSGMFVGLLVTLGICGLLVTLAALATRTMGLTARAPQQRSAVAAVSSISSAKPLSGPLPAAYAGGHAMNGHSLTPMTPPSTAAASAAPSDPAADTTQTEAQLLAAGRFAEYHLAKAKRLLASGEAKEAAYQAGASLAHDRLPEAREVRRLALERASTAAA